jgi:hypothetical protein
MRICFRFGSWLGAGLVLWCSVVAPTLAGPQATIQVRDGRSVTGEIVEQDNKTVTLLIAGIRTPIPRDQIESMTILKSTQEEYADRRAALAENDLEGRHELARWLYDKQEYDLAHKELDDLAQRFPDDSRVMVLRNAVAGQIRLREQQAQETPPTPPREPRPTQPPTEARDPSIPAGLPDNKLTMEQLNLIKLYEVDLTTQPVVVVPRDVIEELFEKYQHSDLTPKGAAAQRAFRTAKGYEQLELIFRLRAREFYPRITVSRDPPAFQTFRTQLHQSYVINYCATNGCHGDASGGNLFLFRTSPNSDPTVYTNFFILHRYETPTAYMIDRDEPNKSLLLQYGMARDLAQTPHPQVPGYHPQIRQPNDPRIRMITNFITQLYKPAPNYGVDYVPPTPGKRDPAPADTPAVE